MSKVFKQREQEDRKNDKMKERRLILCVSVCECVRSAAYAPSPGERASARLCVCAAVVLHAWLTGCV